MVAIRDRDTEGGSHDSGPLGPGSRPIDNAPETPTDGTPTAAQNQTIPIIYGTARITPRIVYQKPPETIKAFKDWTAADGYAQRDGTGAPTILAIGETPISSIVGWWREGSTKNFPAGTLKYLGGAYQRKVASGGGSSTTVVIPDTALPATILGMPENATVQFTSGTNSGQMRTVASWTATSITLSSALPGTPSMDDSFFVTAGYRVQTADDPGTPIAWLGTWNGATYEGEPVGMGFKGTVYFACPVLALGENGKVPKIQFEVAGKCIDATSTIHANPADVVVDILTSTRYGVGLDAAQVEVEYGPDGLAASSYRRYCDQAGFLVSRAIEGQETAAELLSSLMFCTNSVLVCTQGKVKIIPRCDVAVGTYAPPSTAAVLDENEIVREGTEDFLTIRRTPESEVFNRFPITIEDREADYEAAELAYEDTAHSQQYGQRTASTSRADWITQKATAQSLSSILAQRSIYVRNRYRFRVKPRWALLEPMDVISVSSPSMEISNVRCRIMNLRRLTNGLIEIDADEAPDSVALPVDLTPQPHDGYDSVAPAPEYIGDVPGGISAFLTRESVVLPTTLTGGNYVVSSYSGAVTELKVFVGTADDSVNWTVTKEDHDVTSSVSNQMVTVSAMSDTADMGWVTITGTKGTDTVTKAFTVTKAKQGATGAGGGSRGAGWYYAASTASTATWSDTDANTATPGDNIFQDRVTLYNNNASPPWSMTKFWDGAAWQTMTVYIDGNLLVTGTVAGTALVSNSVTTNKLTVSNFDNLIPNPNSEISAPPGGWPTGAIEAASLDISHPTWAYAGTAFRNVTAAQSGTAYDFFSGMIPCGAGDEFVFQAQTAVDPQTGAWRRIGLDWFTAAGAWTSVTESDHRASDGWVGAGSASYRLQSVSGAAPSNAAFVRFSGYVSGGSSGVTVGGFDNLYARRRVSGPALVVDGTAVFGSGYDPTTKVATGGSADDINNNTTTIDGGKITAGSIKTSNYAEDGSGNPTAGAKLDHTGTALKVAPGNLRVGSVLFANLIQRSSITLSGINSSAYWTFGATEPDTNYDIMATVQAVSGSPPPNAFVVYYVTKSTTQAVVNMFASPGIGNSVTLALSKIRLP